MSIIERGFIPTDAEIARLRKVLVYAALDLPEDAA
jgi:hypothetical protein